MARIFSPIKRKITFLFALVLFQSVFAQNQESKLISLNIRQEPISNVLAAITQQTGIRFSYSSHIIDVNKKVSVQATNQQIDKVLPLFLPQSVSYKQVGKHIILSTIESGKKPENKTEIQKQTELFSTNNEENNNHIYLIDKENTFPAQKKFISSKGIIIDSCHKIVTTINEEEMKKKLALFVLGMSATSNYLLAQTDPQIQTEEIQKETTESVINAKKVFQATFVYPLGTDGVYSSSNQYNLSFNLIGGRTGKVKGFEIAGIFNLNKYSSSGMQIAGVINRAGNRKSDEVSRNVQIAGVSNHTQNGISTQIGGIKNSADTANIQIGGVINLSKKGNVQIAGIQNYTRKGNVQIAGISNVIKTKGQVQIAGIINVSDTVNLQISGITNVAKYSSCQIAPINITTKKGGFQLGVINVRDTADGISLGIINIVRKGGLREWEISGSDIIHTQIAFRSGTQKLYSIISLGHNFSDEFYAIGFGLGTEITLKNRWRLNLEGVHYNLYNKDFEGDYYEGLVQFRPTINYMFAKHFKIFAGPVLNLALINPNDLKVTIPYSIWDTKSEKHNRELNTWVGFTAGLRF